MTNVLIIILIVSSVSGVSVTCIFSCFVNDGFCCVLQCGIMSEGYRGVRTNLRYQTGLTIMIEKPCPYSPPAFYFIFIFFIYFLSTPLPSYLCSCQSICCNVLVSFCCESLFLLTFGSKTLQDKELSLV